MRATTLPIPKFIGLAIRGVAGVNTERHEEPPGSNSASSRFAGLAVILDRKAEQRSQLLTAITQDNSSFDDITGNEILIIVPAPEDSGVGSRYIFDPKKVIQDGITAPGVRVYAPESTRAKLWEFAEVEVAEFGKVYENQNMEDLITRSVSHTRDFLGLDEADVPSLVLLAYDSNTLYVFRYGKLDDPYGFFKEILVRRPRQRPKGWLDDALAEVVAHFGLHLLTEGPINSEYLPGWRVCTYSPRGPKEMSAETSRT